MDGASKKRKLCQDDLDEENEEEKIEKFFALIKGIREARDRLMNGSADPSLKVEIIDTKNKKKRKLEEEKKQVITTVWKPSFLREDFMEDTDDQKLRDSTTPAAVVSTLQVDSSQRKEVMIEKHHENKESLDLNLSL